MGAESSLIASFRVGQYEVFSLYEGTAMEPVELLLGATGEQVAAYLPDGGFPATTNAFLVRGPGVNILADTGYGPDLLRKLDLLGVGPERINAVLISHMHIDHISGLLRDGTAAFPNAQLWVSAPETAYWRDSDITRHPETERSGFLLARQVLVADAGRTRSFLPGRPDGPLADLMPEAPGIRAIAAYGHTPGHTLFLIGSEGGQMLLWGDLAIAMAIQMPLPKVALTYDNDPDASAAARLQILQYAAERGIAVGGAHIPYPGMGRVAADPVNAGAYLFTPVSCPDA